MITRSPVPTVATALLLAIAVAGCGSTAGSTSVAPQSGAGTHQTTSTTSTSDTSGGTSTAGSDDTTVVGVSSGKHAGAGAYLKSITPVRLELAKVRRSTSAMSAAIKAGDGPTAGRNAYAAAAGVRRALALARRARPHNQPWATIHTQLLANLQIGVVYLTQMGHDLTAVDIAAIHRWKTTVLPKIHKSERWYEEWAGNVAALASAVGVKPPHWLHTMDRWN